MSNNEQNELESTELRDFFQSHHDKFICTASRNAEPSMSINGTARMTPNGKIEFELSDDPSVTLNNILENRSVMFMVYEPAERARDYKGVRIYAEVTEILKEGEKLEKIRTRLKEKFGEEKAQELIATLTCEIKELRPIIDRGQLWNELPLM